MYDDADDPAFRQIAFLRSVGAAVGQQHACTKAERRPTGRRTVSPTRTTPGVMRPPSSGTSTG